MAYVGGPITARRVLIAMAQRRQQRGTGSGATFVRERTAWQQWPNLDAVLAPLAWAVVGAVATRQYMPERATRDLDVVVAKADAAVARAKLQAAGYAFRGELRIGGSTWRSPDGQDIDVIEGAEAWWPTALADAQANRDGQGLPVLPLPYLVLIKLQAGRTQDLADISRMLGLANADALEAVRRLVACESPDDCDDLESLIRLGELEFGEAPP